jgi:hypothetical protein
LPLELTYLVSKLDENGGFLRAIKFHSITSFIGEVKP